MEEGREIELVRPSQETSRELEPEEPALQRTREITPRELALGEKELEKSQEMMQKEIEHIGRMKKQYQEMLKQSELRSKIFKLKEEALRRSEPVSRITKVKTKINGAAARVTPFLSRLLFTKKFSKKEKHLEQVEGGMRKSKQKKKGGRNG